MLNHMGGDVDGVESHGGDGGEEKRRNLRLRGARSKGARLGES